MCVHMLVIWNQSAKATKLEHKEVGKIGVSYVQGFLHTIIQNYLDALSLCI